MKELLFEENENINITKYTQIAMLADELAIWSVLREKGLESVVNAGLSLGEYAALVASRCDDTGRCIPRGCKKTRRIYAGSGSDRWSDDSCAWR